MMASMNGFLAWLPVPFVLSEPSRKPGGVDPPLIQRYVQSSRGLLVFASCYVRITDRPKLEYRRGAAHGGNSGRSALPATAFEFRFREQVFEN
ncbi:MAG: hypothetical protein AAF483_15420 [Planctomycetota bacterium]